MKKILNKLAVLFLFFGCYSCGSDDVEQTPCSCFPNVNERYTYPISPGTDEWRKVPFTDEAIKIYQIPDETLKSMSTERLIDAIVHSPLFVGHYVLSSSTPVETWHRIYARLNGVQELSRRDDVGEALTAYYKAIDFSCINSTNEETDIEFERLFGIEFLFTKQEILNKISHKEKQELVKALLSNYNKKTERTYAIVPIAWIMYHDNYQNMITYYTNNLAQYGKSILQGYVSHKEQSESIISIANNYIKTE